jgi:phosphate transport system substrate-binding protein
MKATLAGAAAALAMASVPGTAMARDTISIVGSSTVYPFATVVAERFGRTGNATPKIESTGSGGGMKLFCQGVGTQHPDITNASRRMKKSEFELCQSNGVKDITEVKVGYDGIVIANSVKGKHIDLSLRDVFLALAKDVPNPDGSEELVANPYKTWKEVNPALPNTKIEVLGPPPTSGTRDAFNELAIEGGCKSFPWLKAIKGEDKSKYKAICRSVREDGAYVEAGENDNLIVQKLDANPKALGVFGFSFLEENMDKVRGSEINGIKPSFETIADSTYPISRPLYFYVKKAHVGVIPGVAEFLNEFTSEKAYGEDGYLSDRGLIPMPTEERSSVTASVTGLEPLAL